jgi:hypothetical protein
MTSLEVFHALVGAIEQMPARRTLSDRSKPLIAATCGPTVARRAFHVRSLINNFPTLQTRVNRRPPKHIRERQREKQIGAQTLVFVQALGMRVAKASAATLRIPARSSAATWSACTCCWAASPGRAAGLCRSRCVIARSGSTQVTFYGSSRRQCLLLERRPPHVWWSPLR